MTHLFKYRHRKRAFKNFRIFIVSYKISNPDSVKVKFFYSKQSTSRTKEVIRGHSHNFF